jgi:hypothetical protein
VRPAVRVPFTAAVPQIATALALMAATASGESSDDTNCPTLGSQPAGSQLEDATPTRIREGMALGYGDVALLRDLMPPEVWRNRKIFFFEGMRMEIGPCQRRYRFPANFSATTEEFAGRARVDSDGNLWDYTAGTPFPPESIASDDPDAGVKWAWNLEHRNRGAGAHGHFRITDLPDRTGGAQVYTGEFFHLRTHHRADLVDSEFSEPGSNDNLWVGGGSFHTPSGARDLAWRQMRPVKAQGRYSQPDDTFVYVPTMRKVRRSATSWIDGMYTPRFRIGGDWGGGGVVVGASGHAATGSVSPTSALSSAISEHLQAGFSEFSIRPNAYQWRLLGERAVVAPINTSGSGYPQNPDRNFGPSGLSVASDRWEPRRAVVIEGSSKSAGRIFDSVTIYVDYRTQLPLFLITRTRTGRIIDIGIPIHRFSGDVAEYPRWRNGDPALIFDPVAAVYFRAADGGSGWRRESYDVESVAPPRRSVEQMITTNTLARGR